jgi:hypothetical protein
MASWPVVDSKDWFGSFEGKHVKNIAHIFFKILSNFHFFYLDRAFLTGHNVYQTFILGTYPGYQSEAMLVDYMIVIRRTVGISHGNCAIPDHHCSIACDVCKHHKMLEVANLRLAVGPDSKERNSTELVLTQPMI